MLKKIIFTFIIILLVSSNSYTNDNSFINPGLKFGYRFDSGFVFGVELSVTWWGNQGMGGIVFAYDYCSKTNLKKLNFSVEGGTVAGFAIGPSILFSDTGRSFGITTTLYGGFIAIPYVSANFNFKENSDMEVGSYLKWPIWVGGSGIKM